MPDHPDPPLAAHDPVRSISAVTLLTSDMAASVAFYRAVGLRLRYGGDDAAFTSFVAGAGHLNLQRREPPAPPPGGPSRQEVWGRVILWVDDVDATHRRLLAAGYTPEAEPADAPWGERYFHVRDPEGHELSIARPLSGGH